VKSTGRIRRTPQLEWSLTNWRRQLRWRAVNREAIEGMDWSTKSPNLNPIEHAWDILQHRISNRINQPNSLQELADALVDEWSRISQVEFQTLIRIFQNRCRKVICVI
jgi:hypothetical protein